MAGRKELGFPRTNASSLREQLARTTLIRVRSQGHSYVELREDGKRFIFFCTLCLAPCYSDSVLFDHLKGNLHTERLSAAKVTLLKPNPWPFNDGVLFFNNATENERQLVNSNINQNTLLGNHVNDNNLAIVKYDDNQKTVGSKHIEGDKGVDSNSCSDGGNYDVVIPGVRIKDKICYLKVRFIGFGQIASRLNMKAEGSSGVSRIWCEWLGDKVPGIEDACMAPEHDFSIVAFANTYDLGRKDLFEDVKLLLSSSSQAESEEGEGRSQKRKKSFSDPEDVSESFTDQYHSYGEDSPVSNASSSRLLLDRYDDQLLQTRFISSKSIRRELRRQQRIAAERMCYMCHHKMLPDKDVATLVNMKTGKLACSSRNVNGAFHVFHISCLIHWILLCEFEMMTNQSSISKVRRTSKRKNGAKYNGKGKDGVTKATSTQISSVFCPECQGTGINIEGDVLEKEETKVSLSQMFEYKLKVSDGRKAWMKSPEVLENCSMGFHFPSFPGQSEQTAQKKVSPLKLLRFYSADQ